MKKIIISISLCLLTAFVFAQSRNVAEAQKFVKMGTPDYVEARKKIEAALVNSETANDAKTWYVAGWIESQQFEGINDKLIIGTQLTPEEQKTMYQAIIKMLPYFVKASELDNLPDAKGKVKPKYKNNIKNAIKSAHNQYINGGLAAFQEGDYPKAYEFWHNYTTIPDLPVFEGDRDMIKLKADTSYAQILFYEGLAASNMGDPKKAIAAYEQVKKTGYNHEEVLRYLSYEYNQASEKEKYIETLKQASQAYPDSIYFLMSQINYYIENKENQKAVVALEEAIQRQPGNSDLYRALGEVYDEEGSKEKACENFKKAIEYKPDNIEALVNLGRIYFNEGVKKRNDSDNASDQAMSRQLQNESRESYRMAMPYFEKAHQLEPEDQNYMNILRTIYYNLDMGDKMEQMTKLLGL